jgi:predicted transcriptional regulator
MMDAAIEKPKAGHLTVKLDPDERLRLQSIAHAKQRTPHFIMREAITRYIEQEEVQQRFLAAAEQSRKHYSETGLHITHEEFSQWVDALQSNPKAQPPKIHA